MLIVLMKYFGDFKVKEGRLPKNSNEVVIPEHILSNNYQIGDTLDLELGYRYHAGAPIDNNDEYYHMGYDSEEETLIIETSQNILLLVLKKLSRILFRTRI